MVGLEWIHGCDLYDEAWFDEWNTLIREEGGNEEVEGGEWNIKIKTTKRKQGGEDRKRSCSY